MIANSIMAYMAMFRNGQDRSLQSKTLGPALTPNSYFLTPNLPFLRYYGQHRTIPALRLKHRSGSCGTASALPKCSIMSGCGTRIVLRFAVSATGGAHLCSIQYYLRFWLSSCRTSLAVSALRIMRYCPDKSISDKQENSLDKQSRITAWNAAGGVILYLSISAIIL